MFHYRFWVVNVRKKLFVRNKFSPPDFSRMLWNPNFGCNSPPAPNEDLQSSHLTITCTHEVHTQWYTEKNLTSNQSTNIKVLKHHDLQFFLFHQLTYLKKKKKRQNYQAIHFFSKCSLIFAKRNNPNCFIPLGCTVYFSSSRFGKLSKPWWQYSAPQHCQWLEEG